MTQKSMINLIMYFKSSYHIWLDELAFFHNNNNNNNNDDTFVNFLILPIKELSPKICAHFLDYVRCSAP